MTPPKSRLPEPEDLTAALGLAAAGAGCWMRFGLDITLMVVGGVLLAAAVFGQFRSARRGP